MRRTRLSRSHGFTLAEIIVVVAVMAILASLSAPVLFQFIKQRDVQQEQNNQIELTKAVQAYLDNVKSLPAEATWFTDLARYTNLSPLQIRFDAWGNERRYVMTFTTQNMLGSNVNIYYATILSAGNDQTAQSVANRIPVANPATFTYNAAAGGNIGGFAASNNNGWWKAQANPETAFTDTTAAGDDILLRFTDYSSKLEKYQTSLNRLSKIADALESFGKASYAEELAAAAHVDATNNTATPENMIYYPLSWSNQANGAAPDSWGNYSWRAGQATATSYNGGRYAGTIIVNPGHGPYGYVYNGADNNSLRYDSMVMLMRILGLPDETCCSALDSFIDTDGVTRREMPFYYASNPRPRSGAACGARPNPRAGQATLPARVSVIPPTNATACY